MIVVKKSLSRRTVLRGMGVTLGLPLLDAMVPALSALTKTAAKPAQRFSAVYVPNGITMAAWTPAAEGTAFELTPILKPLAPLRDRVLVISGLNGPAGQDHYGASTGFLTGVEDGGRARMGEPRRGLKAGVSVDQLMAQAFGRHTELASLELAVDGMEETTGSAYTNTISWRTATQPLPMENNPRRVFERLFGDSGTTDPQTPGRAPRAGEEHPRFRDPGGRQPRTGSRAERPRQDPGVSRGRPRHRTAHPERRGAGRAGAAPGGRGRQASRRRSKSTRACCSTCSCSRISPT